MKKMTMLILLVGLMAFGAFGETFVSRAVQPGTNNVATFTQDFTKKVAVPILIYTDLTGTTTNAVTVAYAPDLATNATDYGVSYPIGSFSTVGGAEAPIVLNTPTDTNSIGNIRLNRGDSFTATGAGGTASTNVMYRCVYRIE